MNVQKEFILTLAAQGKRADGRGLEDFRPIQLHKNVVEKAEGSARVRMGDTDVLVGVKLGVGEPFPDKLNEGVLIVSAELSPMAHPDFEMGPPREDAIELARVVDRGIREAGAIDVKKLCIAPGEKVWTVSLDVQIINHGGNLIDAYSLASMAALLEAKLPALDEKGNVQYGKHTTTKLPLTAKPMAVTVFKLPNGALLVDPDLEEEKVAEARLTVTTTENGHVTALQKGGAPLSPEEVEQAIQLSLTKGKELRKLLG